MVDIDRRTFIIATGTATALAGCVDPDPTSGYGRGPYGGDGYGR